MYKVLFFPALVLFSSLVSGQDQTVVDSLHEVLLNTRGADSYAALERLAVEYIDANNELALQIIEEAEQTALSGGDSSSIVRSQRLKGQILFRLDRIEELISTYSRALPLAERIKSFTEYILIANVFGNGYLYQSRFDKALQYYFLAYDRARKDGDVALIGMVLGNIGIAYYKLKDYARAVHYLLESHTIKKNIGSLGYDTPINLSLCYFQLKNYKNAIRFLDESLILCGTGCPDKSMTHIKYASGCIALGMEQFDEAEIEFTNSYYLAKESNDRRMQLDNIYLLAEILIKKKRIREAIHFLREGENLVDLGVSFPLEMIKLYWRFSELYISIKDFEKASLYQSKYISLKDSIYSDGLTTNLMKIESQFLERENQEKLATQEEIIKLKEHVIGRQYRLNVLATLLAIISILFFVFLFRNYKRNENISHLLDKKIRERTKELESNKNELIKALRAHDLFAKNIMEEILNAAHTIEGLCCVGLKDVMDPTAYVYFSKIDKTAAQLSDSLRTRYQNVVLLSKSK